MRREYAKSRSEGCKKRRKCRASVRGGRKSKRMGAKRMGAKTKDELKGRG
jgi:hypothetical protein